MSLLFNRPFGLIVAALAAGLYYLVKCRPSLSNIMTSVEGGITLDVSINNVIPVERSTSMLGLSSFSLKFHAPLTLASPVSFKRDVKAEIFTN